MKTILVTGSARGIGLAIVKKLLAEGNEVYGVDKLYGKDKSADAQASSLINEYSNAFKPIFTDLEHREQISKLASTLASVKIDGIVNDAGVVYLTKWDDFNTDEYDETLAVNMTAPLLLVFGLRNNLAAGSSIVNIASTDAMFAAYDTIAYAVSKAGLISITKSLAAILGPKNIRSNAIAPGWVETEMTKDTLPAESRLMTPLRRNAQADEIAKVASFLLSDQSSFINGSVVVADGGMTVVDYTILCEAGLNQAVPAA